MTRFLAFLSLELKVLRRRSGAVALGMAVLVLAVILFVLAQPAGSIAPGATRGAVWLAVFLVAAQAQASLLADDVESGFAQQWPLLPLGLEAVIAAKFLAHWLMHGAGFLLAVPVAALLGGLPVAALPWLLASLIPASLCLSVLGGVAAAASSRFRYGEAIAMLLVLPVAAPVVIFASTGASGFRFLLALALMVTPLGVWATARLLRYPV